MARPIKQLTADKDTLMQLRRCLRASTVTVRERERAEMVLLRLEGLSVAAVAERAGFTKFRTGISVSRGQPMQ